MDCQETDGNDSVNSIMHKKAVEGLTAIEVRLSEIKNSMYAERSLNMDKELLLIENGTHPELVKFTNALKEKLLNKLSLMEIFLNYNIMGIESATEGIKSSTELAFNDNISWLRENMLKEMGERWYELQREKRHMEIYHASYSYSLPTDLLNSIRLRTAYNYEVSILSGLSKYLGFPSAKFSLDVSSQEIQGDLISLGIVKSSEPS